MSHPQKKIVRKKNCEKKKNCERKIVEKNSEKNSAEKKYVEKNLSEKKNRGKLKLTPPPRGGGIKMTETKYFAVLSQQK